MISEMYFRNGPLLNGQSGIQQLAVPGQGLEGWNPPPRWRAALQTKQECYRKQKINKNVIDRSRIGFRLASSRGLLPVEVAPVGLAQALDDQGLVYPSRISLRVARRPRGENRRRCRAEISALTLRG